MKPWLYIPIVIVGLVVTFFLTSCQNADEDLIVETVENDDVPIPSLFNESRSPQVLNGDCVIGTILFCGERLGVRITEQEVKDFLGDKYIPGKGVLLNSADWDALFSHWFKVRTPTSQSDLVRYLIEMKYPFLRVAACRLSNKRDHAVALGWAEPYDSVFVGHESVFRDGVLNSDQIYVPFVQVRDPRFIEKK